MRRKYQQIVETDDCLSIAVRDRYIRFDRSDLELVAMYCWSIDVRKNQTYAITRSGGQMLRLHRHLMCSEEHDGVVDHINGDGLDNRRLNLRRASYSLNALNSHSAFGESGFKGVCRSGSKINPWRAAIKVGYVRHIGVFATEEDAAAAYDDAAKQLLNDAIRLNNTNRAPKTNCRWDGGFKGVFFSRGKFIATCHIQGTNKRKQIGSFSTAVEAAIAYDAYVSEKYPGRVTNLQLGKLLYS